MDHLSFGGAFAWTEGKVDNDNDTIYEKYINGSRIMAPKVTGYIQWFLISNSKKKLS